MKKYNISNKLKGGIIIRHRIIIVSKRNIIISLLVILVLIAIVIGFVKYTGSDEGVTSSGYTYLKLKDGTFTGVEKVNYGNIKVEVMIKDEKIKNIKIVELPQKFFKENPNLKDELEKFVFDTIQNQQMPEVSVSAKSAYVLSKLSKSIRVAMDQSMITQ